MNFTQFQKDLIKDILNKDIADIESFVKKHVKHSTDITGFNYSVPSGAVIGDKETGLIVEAGQYDKFVEFKIVWDFLLQNGYIYNIENENPKNNLLSLLVKTKNGNSVGKEERLMMGYIPCKIYSLPILSDFVKNEFRTQNEQNIEREIKDRKRAQNITIGIAVISIIASILSVIFNSKQRDVFIKNNNAFRDTIHVTIEQHQESTKLIKKK
jgi:hypothetical protein